MARSRSTTALLLGVLATWIPAAVLAGDIVGAVTVPPVARKSERGTNAAYGSRLAARPGEDDGEIHTEAQNVVVFIKQRIDGDFAPPATYPEMAQRGASFVPRVLPVVQGTTVSFPNEDPIYHNIFSLSKGANFNLGRYPKGETKTYRFDRPGMVRVNCDIHADMLGFVLVLPHTYFATPDALGAYRIEGVPPGKYHLVAWHDTLPPQVRPLVVPEAGDLTADFTF